MEKITVLLIEDNTADSLLVKEYLCENKHTVFRVIEADSLNKAKELIPHYDFDVLLLDLHLPDSTGVDTVRQIITHVPETAVIVLTGLQDEEITRQTKQYGAQDVLNKRYLSPESLRKSIRYSLERRQMIEEKEDLLQSLDQALKKIKQLEDLLPLCINCKRFLSEENYWHSFEEYLESISFKSTQKMLCPDCRADLDGL